MTQEEFIDLQLSHQSSGLTLKSYLKQIKIYFNASICPPVRQAFLTVVIM